MHGHQFVPSLQRGQPHNEVKEARQHLTLKLQSQLRLSFDLALEGLFLATFNYYSEVYWRFSHWYKPRAWIKNQKKLTIPVGFSQIPDFLTSEWQFNRTFCVSSSVIRDFEGIYRMELVTHTLCLFWGLYPRFPNPWFRPLFWLTHGSLPKIENPCDFCGGSVWKFPVHLPAGWKPSLPYSCRTGQKRAAVHSPSNRLRRFRRRRQLFPERQRRRLPLAAWPPAPAILMCYWGKTVHGHLFLMKRGWFDCLGFWRFVKNRVFSR